MAKSFDWRKDKMLKATSDWPPKDSVWDLANNAGKPMWSKSAGKLMPPSKAVRIDPKSPEGQAIAAKAINRIKRV